MSNEEQVVRQVLSAVEFYIDHYYKKLEDAQLATGSITSGEVGEEYKTCIAIWKSAKAQFD